MDSQENQINKNITQTSAPVINDPQTLQNNFYNQNPTDPTLSMQNQASPNDAQQTSTSPSQPSAKPRKSPLVLSSIAFTLLSLALFAAGPGVFLVMLSLQEFSWIVSFFYIYIVIGVAIATIIGMVFMVSHSSKSSRSRRSISPICLLC